MTAAEQVRTDVDVILEAIAEGLLLRFGTATVEQVRAAARAGDAGATLWLDHARIAALDDDAAAAAWLEGFAAVDQARAPAGSPDGGQFVKEGEGGGGDVTVRGVEAGAREEVNRAARDLPPKSEPLERGMALQGVMKKAVEAGMETEALHDRVVGQRGRYTPERESTHRDIVREKLQEAIDRGARQDREAIMLAGLPGAGKTSATKGLIDTDGYVVISPDDMKEEIARRGMVDPPEGVGALEAASLIHEESSKLAKDLGEAATSLGYNVIWDMTMTRPDSFTDRVGMMNDTNEKYRITGVLVDSPVEQSVNAAMKRYTDGLAEDPNLARFTAPEMIRSQADPTGQYDSVSERTFNGLRDQMDDWVVIDNIDFKGEVRETSSPSAIDRLKGHEDILDYDSASGRQRTNDLHLDFQALGISLRR